MTPEANRHGKESREPFYDDLPAWSRVCRPPDPKPRRAQAEADLARLAERMEREAVGGLYIEAAREVSDGEAPVIGIILAQGG